MFIKMCDKIKEGDNRYSSMRKVIDDQGCGAFQDVLELCLTKYDKDWRKCQKEVGDLSKCLWPLVKQASNS